MSRVLAAFRFNGPQVVGVLIASSPGLWVYGPSSAWLAFPLAVLFWGSIAWLFNLIYGPPE